MMRIHSHLGVHITYKIRLCLRLIKINVIDKNTTLNKNIYDDTAHWSQS